MKLIKTITLLFCIISLTLLMSYQVHAVDVQKVLILHSYHKGFAWTEDIMEGMESVFQKTDIDLNVHIEYMDTKRHLPAESFPLLKELYKYRYQDIHFDVILVSDNNALDFLLSNRDELFPDVPVVFCGINNFSNSMLQGQRAITGGRGGRAKGIRIKD